MPSGVYDRYPPEILEYVKKHASSKITRARMLEMVNRDLDCDVTAEYIKSLYYRHDLPFKRNSRHNILLTDEQAVYLMGIIPGRMSPEIRDLMNEKFGLNLTTMQIRTWKKNHKTPSGYSTTFRKGRIPFNKGMSWSEFMSEESHERSLATAFKAGNVPANRKPIGSLNVRSDGYCWIKIKDRCGVKNWMLYHRYVWENANGPIPKDHKIVFLDGNTTNCELSNLDCVPASVLMLANEYYGMVKDPELNKTILQAAKLKMAIAKSERKKKKDE